MLISFHLILAMCRYLIWMMNLHLSHAGYLFSRKEEKKSIEKKIPLHLNTPEEDINYYKDIYSTSYYYY